MNEEERGLKKKSEKRSVLGIFIFYRQRRKTSIDLLLSDKWLASGHRVSISISIFPYTTHQTNARHHRHEQVIRVIISMAPQPHLSRDPLQFSTAAEQKDKIRQHNDTSLLFRFTIQPSMIQSACDCLMSHWMRVCSSLFLTITHHHTHKKALSFSSLVVSLTHSTRTLSIPFIIIRRPLCSRFL